MELNRKTMKFWGYRRNDGRVGVRNHVLILFEWSKKLPLSNGKSAILTN